MSRRHARMKGHTRWEKKPSPVVVGQARSWKEFKAGREARIEREVSRLRGNAIGLARGMGGPVPRVFTCDDCPCAPRCLDSFDLVNVGGFCVAIGRRPSELVKLSLAPVTPAI